MLKRIKKFGIETALVVFIMTGLLSGLSGCTESTSKSDIKQNPKGVCVVIIVEDCEYVLYREKLGNGSPGGLTHKGNCKFCYERNAVKNR